MAEAKKMFQMFGEARLYNTDGWTLTDTFVPKYDQDRS